MKQVLLYVGTRKGVFTVEADPERRGWSVRGPGLPGQDIRHTAFDARTGTLFAASGDPWFGSRVYQSNDQGRTWDEPITAPAFPEGSGQKLERVWRVEPGPADQPGVVYAGVEPAALFRSVDGGGTWELVNSLNEHPTRSAWQPGAGGLCLHTVLSHPTERRKLLVAISAAGVFKTDDGGDTWRPANQGTRVNFEPGEAPKYPEWGQCVHHVVQAPDQPDLLYQQNHCGVYRSDDWGDSWTEITQGLPSDWGLAIGVHPRDPDTLYVCPGTSGFHHWVPEGRMAVYRSRDRGGSWQLLDQGLPSDAYLNVLREGMALDTLDPCGVYVGTNTGQLFYSADEGASWRLMDPMFPPISSVAAVVL